MINDRFRQLRVASATAFSHPRGWLIAILAALSVMALAMLLPSAGLLRFIVSDAQFPLALKFASIASVFWSGRLALVHSGGGIVFILAALFGVNAALTAEYMRRQARLHHEAGASLGAMLIGLLGVGCASCGSVVLSSLLGAGSTVGVLSFLPYKGMEFGWIGLGIMLYATFAVSAKLTKPETCAIP